MLVIDRNPGEEPYTGRLAETLKNVDARLSEEDASKQGKDVGEDEIAEAMMDTANNQGIDVSITT